jgi:signal peptidase I
MIALLLLIGVAVTALWWARRHLILVTVRGSSMAPTLVDGQLVLVRRRPGTRIRAGRIVVVNHPDSTGGYRPDGGWMIKRCVAAHGDPVPADLTRQCPAPDGRVPFGSIVLRSDEPSHPNDSRRFGFIPAETVLGVVLFPSRRSQ